MGQENQPGEITNKIKTAVGDIMYGRTQHEWGVVIPEKQ
jgi:branched-chain amino acid aminotransferase